MQEKREIVPFLELALAFELFHMFVPAFAFAMEAKLPINAAPSQKNAAFIRGLKEKIASTVQLGNLHHLSKKARNRNFKRVSLSHNIYQ